MPQHPASEQSQRLIELLGGVTASLENIEQQRPRDANELKSLQTQVGEGVALASSLSDALALVGDQKAVPAIGHVMQLAHRRTRTEAAAALTRLGDSQGEAELVQLAAYPVARLRVLAYAEELGVVDQIPDEYQTPLARAESELAVYLAEPAMFGLPPDALERIDSRTQYWPGYDQPVECFLFQFAYHLPQGTYENVGLVGPALHAFAADMTGLSVEDLYAAFAGWLAEHREIAEVTADELNAEQLSAVEEIVAALTQQGCVDVTPVKLGYFFGEWPLVVTGRYQDAVGIAVAGREGIEWFAPDPGQRHPLGPDDAYNIWKGRRLLAAFNQ